MSKVGQALIELQQKEDLIYDACIDNFGDCEYHWTESSRLLKQLRKALSKDGYNLVGDFVDEIWADYCQDMTAKHGEYIA
jgi:hypothetical protein